MDAIPHSYPPLASFTRRVGMENARHVAGGIEGEIRGKTYCFPSYVKMLDASMFGGTAQYLSHATTGEAE